MIQCTFEHGNVASLRHATADTIAFDSSHQVLLVRRASFLTEGGKWALPGGYLDRDESAADGARRELLEETGYSCGELTLLRISTDPNRPGEDRQNIPFIFFAFVSEKVGEADDESEEIRWFSLDELPSRDEIAFDHYDHLECWMRYRDGKITIPELV